MKRVSLCIIAKNEANNIEACIAPLCDLVHEILVIDTGSTDDTKAIAARLGARVVEFPWCDDFSAARNQWMKHATGDWIFWLDADDRMLEAEVERLRNLVAELDDPKKGYLLSCVCLTVDGAVGCEVEQVRLYPNRPQHRWRYRLHEQITPALFDTGCTLESADVRIVHTGYVDPAVVEKKSARNQRLVEMDCVEHASDAIPLFNKAVMLIESEKFDEAIVALHLCQPFIPANSLAGPRAKALLATAHRGEGRLLDALDEARSGRVLYPQNRELGYLEAQLLIELGDLPGALGVLLELVPGVRRDVTILDARMRTLFGELSLRLGRPESAYDSAKEVTRTRPSYGPAWLLLADACVALEKDDDLDDIERRLASCGGAEIARLLVRAIAAPVNETRDVLQGHDEPFVARVRDRLETSGRALPLLSCLSPPWITEKPKPTESPRVFWQAAF